MATIPKGLDIDPESPMLYHYFKSIHPHQVSFRIKKRKQLQHLWELCKLYENKMDTLASAAMLGQLFRLQKRNNPDYSVELANQIFEHCVKRLSFTIRFATYQEIVPVLFTLARMNVSIVPSDTLLLDPTHRVSREFVHLFLKRAVRNHVHIRVVNPRQMARVLWATAKLFPEDQRMDPRVQDAVDKLARSSVKRLSELHPGSLSIYASAFAKLSPAPTSQEGPLKDVDVSSWDATITGVKSSLLDLDSKELAFVARARTLKVFQGISREILLRVGDLNHEQFTVRNVFHVLGAYIRAQIQDPLVAKVLAENITGRIQDVYAEELIALVRAAERLDGFKNPDLTAAVLRRAREVDLPEETQKDYAKRLQSA
uniref:mS107 n=1 Tax=Polytomella magna TaxID=353565 RepID=UPI002240E44A|nr:Chain BF, mS107 [Polytomella magna]8APN_BF Chain BF, mS107 [Polytomella magna]8APO_BF Chain BF, mS107 [Polytomella magna]